MEEEIEALYADRPGSIHAVSASPSEMSPPGGGFVLVDVDGRAAGCGGLKGLDGETCEIKRMYLGPEARGRGLGSLLVGALEERGRALGYSRARLDTGDRQPAAIRLYKGAGYHSIPDYNGNTAATLWFEKDL